MVSPLASDCFLRWICSTVLNQAFKDDPLENSFCRSFSQYSALQALTTFISPVSQFDSLNLKRTFTPLCHGWTLSLACNIMQPKASLPLFFMYQWSLLLDIQGPESHYFIYFSDFLSCIEQGNKTNSSYSIIDVIRRLFIQLPSVQSVSSVTQSCQTLCDPMNRCMPGLPVHHQLLEFTQTHVRQVSDNIQPSHLLSSSSPPAPNPSQHQDLFRCVNSLHLVAKVLEFQLQHQSFQWTPRANLLQDGLVGSPCSPKDSQESSPTPLFKSINSSVLSFLHSPTLTSIHDHWKNHSLD